MLDLVKQDAGPLWLADGLAKLDEQRKQEELEQKRKADRAFSNLLESLRYILGEKAAEEIIRSGEPGPEIGSILHDRFMFVGRSDACGLGFYIKVPGYKFNGHHSRDILSSDWISDLPDVARAVKYLFGQMQSLDEKEAETRKRRAELDAMMQVKPVNTASPEDRYLADHLRDLATTLELSRVPNARDEAIIHSIRAIYSISEMIGQSNNDDGDYQEIEIEDR